jgi:hypothetical protein
LRLGEDVVAGIDRSKAPRGASPRRAELAPTSPGSPSQRKKKLRPHETQTVAFCSKVHGEGLRTALTRQATSFVIEAHDASGTRQHTGGDAFVVQIKGRSMVSSKVSDREDGSYVAVYRTPVSGAYLISVYLHGAHVAESPYEVTVLEPRPHAAHCVLRGYALNWAVAREVMRFEVEFVDALGQVAPAEELDVYVERVRPAGAAGGGGAAGLNCAETLRQSNFTGEILVLSNEK